MITNGPKIYRAASLKRGRESVPIIEKVKLERVLGLTVSSNAALDSDEQSGTIAYPAGCVVVLHNLKKNKQVHLQSLHKKTITSLAFSSDGKYLATGECGHQPHLRIWDIQEKVQVAEFPGHKYGISCVAFSPNLKYAVSVGSQHDMIVNVWDWKNNLKVASNKVSAKVKAIAFNLSGSYFVTVGNRHVKFWYLEYNKVSKFKMEPVPLMGRSAILGDQRNNYFRDVACGRNVNEESAYSITKSGLLCQFNSRRLLEKWVELKTASANCLAVGDHHIFIGCTDGIVRCFDPSTLHYICTLPLPHALGVDLLKAPLGSKPIVMPNARYPHTAAISYDQVHTKLTCIYNDHSLYVWDVRDLSRIGKSLSFLYHSACIWGIEMYPDAEPSQHILPPGTFVTCSSDDTIRIWNLNSSTNIYSNDLLKILYMDPELAFVCDSGFASLDKSDVTYDGQNGVRCLKINPEGIHLAAGDRAGNIRIFDLREMNEIYKVEAHDGEVLCLEYSKSIDGRQYLASSSRDRLIHVFDASADYSLHQTLDDHSSSITAVCFIPSNSCQQLQMISCGADKSIIFRRAQVAGMQVPNFMREHHVVGKTTLYDMAVDSDNANLLTACQDRNVRVYTISGKPGRCFRGSQGDDGTLIKVVMDPTGSLVATSCTDKNLYIYDYHTEECLAMMYGHSELVTGLKFSMDGSRLISVSGDGCIFIWKLPLDIIKNLNFPFPRKNIAITKPLQPLEQNNNNIVDADDTQYKTANGHEIMRASLPNLPPTTLHDPPSLNDTISPKYRFSLKTLPSWAKKQMTEEISNSTMGPSPETLPTGPRGRWAQRIDGQGLVVRSYLESDAVIPFPTQANGNESQPNSDDEYHLSKEDMQNGPSSMKPPMGEREESFETSEQSLQEILQPPTSSGNEDDERPNLRISRGSESSSILADQLANDLRIRTASSAEDEGSETEGSEILYYLPFNGLDYNNGTFQVCEAHDQEVQSDRKTSSVSSPVDMSSSIGHEGGMSEDEDVETHHEKEKYQYDPFISTENLAQLDQRERFIKSNYESLDTTYYSADEQANNSFAPRHSISTKFLSKSLHSASSCSSPFRNGSDGTSTPPPQTVKRVALQKSLSEAKKKLDSIGFSSSGQRLSSSKSLGDFHKNAGLAASPTSPTSPLFSQGEMKNRNSLVPSNVHLRRAHSMANIDWGASPLLITTHKPQPQFKDSSPARHLREEEKRLQQSRSSPAHTQPQGHHLSGSKRTPPNSTSKPFTSTPQNGANAAALARYLSKSISHINDASLTSESPPNREHGLNQADLSNSSGELFTTPSFTKAPNSPVLQTIIKNPPRPRTPLHISPSPGHDGPLLSRSKDHYQPKMAVRQSPRSQSEWNLSMPAHFGSPQPPHHLSPLKSKSLFKAKKSSHKVASSSFTKPSHPSGENAFSSPLPSTVTPSMCQTLVEEMYRINRKAGRLFHKVRNDASLPENEKAAMMETLASGIQESQKVLGEALPFPEPLLDDGRALRLLAEYSDKLLNIVEKKMVV